MTVPAEGSSSPASRLSTVVLPQPECPMMQVNSPRAIDSQRFSKIVVTPPCGAAKRLVIASMAMNLSLMRRPRNDAIATRLLLEGHQPRRAREHQIEQHADEAYHHNGGGHIGDGEIVPLVPHEITDAGAAHEHFSSDDHQPGDADRYAHPGEDGGCRSRQDDGEGPAEHAHFERPRDVEPFASHRSNAEGRI